MEGLQRVTTLFNDAIDLAILSLFLVVGLVGFIPGIQKRWSYAGAALVLGTMFGLAARWAPFLPAGSEVVGVILGVVVGPATVAHLQGKTIAEAIDEIRSMRRGGGS